jgi:hypothetical protein
MKKLPDLGLKNNREKQKECRLRYWVEIKNPHKLVYYRNVEAMDII